MMVEEVQTTLILSGFGLAGLGAALMAGLKAWQGWLDLKRAELAPPPPQQRTGGEERADIAELRVRVRQLEAIASCVDP